MGERPWFMGERRWLLLLAVAWVATRVALGLLTVHADVGPYRDRAPATHDIVLYDFWSDQVSIGNRPYVDFALEYPPANLPFLLVPETTSTLTGTAYGTNFIVQMAVIDGLAFVGLVLLARRPRRPGGTADESTVDTDPALPRDWWIPPTAWIVLLPLLGPVALSRLDVVPAAAVIWGVLLAARARWVGAGALLGIATGTKVFAGLLAPVWLFLAPARRRVRLVAGAVAAGAVPLLLFLDVPGGLFDDIWRFHSSRGITVESSWGSLLLLGNVLGDQSASIELRLGAWEIFEPAADALKSAATLAVLAVAGHAAFLAHRVRGLGDLRVLAALTASTIVLSVGLGNVLSVQYVVWCVAAVAAAGAVGVPVRGALVLMTATAAMSHLVFPIYFFDIIGDQEQTFVLLLVARNAALLGAGALLWREAHRLARGSPAVAAISDPGVEQDERVPAVHGHGITDPEGHIGDTDSHDHER